MGETKHTPCEECGSAFGHIEGCSHVGDAMKRDALLNGKAIPAAKPIANAIPIRPHQLLADIDKQISRLRARALTGTLQPDMVLGLVEKLDQLSQEMSRELVALSREVTTAQFEASIERIHQSPEAFRQRRGS